MAKSITAQTTEDFAISLAHLVWNSRELRMHYGVFWIIDLYERAGCSEGRNDEGLTRWLAQQHQDIRSRLGVQ